MNGVGKLWKDLGPKFLAHGKEAPQIGQVFFLVQNNVVVIMRGDSLGSYFNNKK